jgi:hypothetical protein
MTPQPGDIMISNNLKSFFKGGALAILIRFFTKQTFPKGKPSSHSAVITNPLFGVPCVHEAGPVIQMVPWRKYYELDPSQDYRLYRIKPGVIDCQDAMIQKALAVCHLLYSGVIYGALQLVWFVWRWVNEKIGRDVRHEKNWMTDGVICSELVYWFLVYLGPVMGDLFKAWNADTIQPGDIEGIILSRPDLFELIAEKKQGVITLGG